MSSRPIIFGVEPLNVGATSEQECPKQQETPGSSGPRRRSQALLKATLYGLQNLHPLLERTKSLNIDGDEGVGLADLRQIRGSSRVHVTGRRGVWRAAMLDRVRPGWRSGYLTAITSVNGTGAPPRALLTSAASMNAMISTVSSIGTGDVPVLKKSTIADTRP